MRGDIVKVFNYSNDKWAISKPKGPGDSWHFVKDAHLSEAFINVEGERFEFQDDGSNEISALIAMLRSDTNFHIYEMHE